MCIFKFQSIDKGTNKVTKENVQENKNVQFDTTSSRYDLAIKEVEERVKLGWSVKASFMLGGGYLRVDYVRADPNRYKDVGKSSNTLDTNETVDDAESSGYGGLGSVGCEEATELATTAETPKEVVEAPVAEVKEAVKPTRKTTNTKKA